jgi:hypothetical protein
MVLHDNILDDEFEKGNKGKSTGSKVMVSSSGPY